MQSEVQNQKDQKMKTNGLPPKQGLYDPQFEHDACGVGFVVNVKGKKSHEIITQALTILINLDHRGACGCEVNTGDGAGILMQMPHKFLEQACAGKDDRAASSSGFKLPPVGQYGAGLIFLPQNATARKTCEKQFEKIVAEEGQTFLGWRTVPCDNSDLGNTAKASEPCIRQAFIARSAD